jgi:Dyp-type peroxidase family
MDAPGFDYSDVQGLVRFGHAHLPEACFLLLRVENAAAVRSWLATVAITTAESVADLPHTALQVAFTCPGLQALGVPAAVIQSFSPEFIGGMSGEDSRSRRLGDVALNAPTEWRWGGPGNEPHLLLMLYAGQGKIEEWKKTVIGQLPASGFSVLQSLSTAVVDGYEPFGFKDGLSQPQLDWSLERKVQCGKQLAYGNLLALGEFLLGYPNEYGNYTDRPMVDVTDDRQTTLLPAVDQPDKRDLGRNGTYLVFRHLRQDVQGFWQFVDKQSNGNPTIRQALAEAMVGRTQEGAPLVPVADTPIPGVGPKPDDVQNNQFTYASDSAGMRCPFGAHIRRANPRNADLPDGASGFVGRLHRILGFCRDSLRTDTIASSRFHRLLRRGRKYGAKLTTEQAIQRGQPDGQESGLYFICLNANIGRQFEFVQNAWIMSTKFNGLTEESDPLLGNRTPVAGCSVADTFSLPQPHGVRRRVAGMPQFVTVRGGAYFFLPGIRAVRYLATLSG